MLYGLFLDQSERIEFGYFTYNNLTNKYSLPSFPREKLISVIISFSILDEGHFQAL